MSKRILITGGFGFLGSHLIDEILYRNSKAEIHVVDNLSSNAVNPKLFTADKPTVTYTICSVQEYFDLAAFAGDGGLFDEIYHLASIVGPAGVLPHEGKIVKSIVDDAFTATYAAKHWPAKLVFVSTSEVYGGGQEGYCSEEMDCIIKADPSARLEYAIGKLGAETAILDEARPNDGLNAVIVRPFNIAGSRQQATGGFVLPRFLKAAQDGTPLQVFGSGEQVRALTDVRDVANGIYLAMKVGTSGHIYNIGNEDNKTTIKALAQRVINLTDTDSSIAHVDPQDIWGRRYVEANDKFPNSAKAQAVLGWMPKYSLDDIIKSAIKQRTKR